MAHALTAVRLFLVVPTAVAFAQPDFLAPRVLFALIWVAIATDYGDGKVARMTGTASPRGQLFDHTADFLFVTVGLTGAAAAGFVTSILPVLITVAFSQYVLDSFWLYRQKQLRMSVIGRWNGIFYFVPLVVLSGARLGVLESVSAWLALTAGVAGYALAASTVVSIVDRALAPLRSGETPRQLARNSTRNDHQ